MDRKTFMKQVKLYDMVRITCKGKSKPRNYTGIVTSLGTWGDAIVLQQKNMERRIKFEKILEVEVLERVIDIICKIDPTSHQSPK